MDSIKDSYISAISQINPFDDEEREEIVDAVQWIKSTIELCKPENMGKHICAISVILSKDRKKTFLIDHIKAKTWLPPGGHVEKGETFIETIKKELREELGIASVFINENPFFLSQTKAQDKHGIHTDVTAWFLVEGDENISYSVLEEEATSGKWFTMEQVFSNVEVPFMLRAFQKIKS